MKLFIGIVAIVATLVLAIWFMSPGDASSGRAPGGASGKVTDDKIAVISKGERVTIEEHLKEGRFTVVEFTADW